MNNLKLLEPKNIKRKKYKAWITPFFENIILRYAGFKTCSPRALKDLKKLECLKRPDLFFYYKTMGALPIF